AGDVFFGAAIKGNGFELWVNETFGQGDQFGVLAGAAAHFADFSFVSDVQAAIAGDFFDRCFSMGDVRDGPGEGDGDFDGSLGAVETSAEEIYFDDLKAGVLVFDH